MPAYPDDRTLRLRGPDRRTPAQLADLIERELAPRPPGRELRPTLADAGLSPADRRLVSFRERYPGVVERVHPGLLWAVAHGRRPGPARPPRCPDGWCLIRAYARGHRLPAPKVDQLGRRLLGDPGPRCQVALGWRPAKPKRKPKPARSTSTRTTTRRRPTTAAAQAPPAALRQYAATVAAAAMPAARAAYNRDACKRLGLDPARARHLTRARP